jgi:hypothetical protein
MSQLLSAISIQKDEPILMVYELWVLMINQSNLSKLIRNFKITQI